MRAVSDSVGSFTGAVWAAAASLGTVIVSALAVAASVWFIAASACIVTGLYSASMNHGKRGKQKNGYIWKILVPSGVSQKLNQCYA